MRFVGYAQAIEYCRTVLGDASYDGAIGVVLGGDASVATNGFWSALTMATTLKLPMLFYGLKVCWRSRRITSSIM